MSNTSVILIPTYNESENIRELIEQVSRHAPDADILVIDDNSPDGTAKIVEDIQATAEHVHLLLRTKKQGLGAAYTAGFSWGLSRDYKQFLLMDADFSHAPADTRRILDALDEFDLVSGSRYTQGGSIDGWGWIRNSISRGGNWYARSILNLSFGDLTGGFNGLRRQVLEQIGFESLRSRGYAFAVELKYRAHRCGFKCTEIPICFENRRLGTSKMSGSIVLEAAYRVWQMRSWTASNEA